MWELNVIFLLETDPNPHLSWRINDPYGRPRVSFCFCEINSYDNADNVGDNRDDDEDNDDDHNENWASLNLKQTPGLLEVGLFKLPFPSPSPSTSPFPPLSPPPRQKLR